MRIVPDTSVIVDRRISELVKSGKLDGATILIPEVVVGELENQANKGKDIGFEGLEELKSIKALAKDHNIKVEFIGERPSVEEIKLASAGALDAIIRDTAKREKAKLITGDIVQFMVAEAKGIECEHILLRPATEPLIRGFFREQTTSVHLKAGCIPKAKVGMPGQSVFTDLADVPLSAEQVEEIARDTFEHARDERSSIEIGMRGATVIQLADLRVAITRPPFSDAVEITAVHPIIHLKLEDYALSDKLKERIESAEGILIAGAPGMGKSSFAQALAEFFMGKGKVVKTMEKPRDLQVPREVTQYTALEGDMQKTADFLLLVRPDYTIYDELRRTPDFKTFADLRMAGVGMVGVTHATKPIDAVQRLIGRVELGIIPQVVDTIIFIRNGKIDKVYVLEFGVKVPYGMIESDLARPVISVKTLEGGDAEYEIYSFGEEVVVMPVKGERKHGLSVLAEKMIAAEIKKYSRSFEIDITSDNSATIKVPEHAIGHLIGREGTEIKELERRLGLSLQVVPLEKAERRAAFDIAKRGGSLIIALRREFAGRNAKICVGGEFLFSAIVGRKGEISVKYESDTGKRILSAKDMDVMVENED